MPAGPATKPVLNLPEPLETAQLRVEVAKEHLKTLEDIKAPPEVIELARETQTQAETALRVATARGR